MVSAFSSERFTLTKQLLGQGGYGKVVLAHDSASPAKHVAAKVLELTGGLTAAQVQREIEAHTAVQRGERCEFIVELLGDTAATHLQAHLLFLEHCGGGDLLDRVLDCGGLDETRGATLFGQLATAVAHVHARGVAHRDIKLENVMLTLAGTPASPVVATGPGRVWLAPRPRPPSVRFACAQATCASAT